MGCKPLGQQDESFLAHESSFSVMVRLMLPACTCTAHGSTPFSNLLAQKSSFSVTFRLMLLACMCTSYVSTLTFFAGWAFSFFGVIAVRFSRALHGTPYT